MDYLPRSALSLPGRLGLTRAPGRWSSGRDLDSDVRLREDLAAIAGVHEAKVLVTLLERLESASSATLAPNRAAPGSRGSISPIPDMWVPADMDAAHKLVARILRTLERGDNVVVHCWGGLGRAGTIAASCLVARGSRRRRRTLSCGRRAPAPSRRRPRSSS